MSTPASPKFESFRALVSHAETLQAELSTLSEATANLEEVKARMGDCLDEDEARQLLAEMRQAEEVVVIKQIRGKRLTADLESTIADAEIARRAAQTEAAGILRHAPHKVVAAIQEMIESCQHEKGEIRDPRALGDVIQSLVPMVVARQLDEHLHSSTRLYYQDTDPLPKKVELLKQAAARLQRLHDRRDELAAESARLAAACAAFRKAYENH